MRAASYGRRTTARLVKALAPGRFPNDSVSQTSDIWTVDGFVDAANGFSALIRTGFVCSVRRDTAEASGWRSYGVTFGN